MSYESSWQKRQAARDALIAAVVEDVTERANKSQTLRENPDQLHEILMRCWDTEASWIEGAKQDSFNLLSDRFPILASPEEQSS